METLGTIRVLTSNATHVLLRTLVDAFAGRNPSSAVAVEADSAKVMLSRIRDGERADIAVLNAPDIDVLVALGILDAASSRPFTRSRIGLAVRAGTAHPDIRSVDAFRQTLLNARSVAHTVHGASGLYVPKLLERLGIADRVGPKTVTRPGGLIGKVVAAGDAEIAIQQMSELLAVEGIEIVGFLPDEIQMAFDSKLAVFTDSGRRQGVAELIRFFGAPDSAAAFTTSGLERILRADA